jgi:hypothetical protein
MDIIVFNATFCYHSFPLFLGWSPGFVMAGAAGTLRFIGFCLVFTALGMSLTSVVCHFECPPGISEGFVLGVEIKYPVTLRVFPVGL